MLLGVVVAHASLHFPQISAVILNGGFMLPTRVQRLLEQHADSAALLDQLEVARSSAVTPLMFEHQLIDEAVAQRKHIGICVDNDRNNEPATGPRRISTDDSEVAVFVVPTNEEWQIARETLGVVST
ncbi:hypothetical protein AB0I34_42110 [Kribbella sp. NPDC050281]|uniref:hypothetical protein n=1 Tax=Kribbella sp. NPDC050281 TaxID=3155515 RepID=UPI0033E83E5D